MSEIVWLPDSDTVLADIADVCPLIWDAVVAGTVDAAGFFKNAKENPFSATFYPTYVRYRIKTYLERMGLAVLNEEDLETDLALKALPGLGLQIKFRDYQIRLRKSDGVEGHEVPPAGRSLKTQGFYRQENQEHLYLPFPERELQGALGGANLIALWIPKGNLLLSNILLALPKRGGVSRNSVQTHWLVELPRPVVAASVPGEHTDDLRITPRKVENDDVAADQE